MVELRNEGKIPDQFSLFGKFDGQASLRSAESLGFRDTNRTLSASFFPAITVVQSFFSNLLDSFAILTCQRFPALPPGKFSAAFPQRAAAAGRDRGAPVGTN